MKEKKKYCFNDMVYYNDELTQKDVADLLGISQSYISRLEKKIIKKLRSQLNYDEVK